MYFYHDGENEVGPFSRDKLIELADGGLIGRGTLVREGKEGAWVPLSALEADSPPPPQASGDAPDSARPAAPVEPTAPDIDPTFRARESDDDPGHADPVPPSEARDTNQGPATRPSPTPLESGSEVSSRGWRLQPPTPWRRYGARILDTTLNGLVAFMLIGTAFYAIAPATADEFFSVFESPAGPILDTIATAFLASLVGGALIGTTGFTVGKWIFGIKVTRKNEKTLGIGAGIARDFEVWLKGLGAGIPLVALVTMLVAYNRLTTRKQTSWDEDRYLVWSRPSGSGQTLLNIIGILLIFAVLGFTRMLAGL